ncbi:MAG TPA: hypothetical protein VNT52_00485 [Acidimicrobiales bacterium]|nr:hypothetical protein [Acidimicrobiales bacterium]
MTGFLDRRAGLRTDTMAEVIGRMTDTLSHRGPDDDGTWLDAESGVAFGHRRLAVIDLSAAGCQPMASHGGRYVLTYNGEIYNSAAIGAELAAAGHRFRGHSDTEVLVTAIEQWGLHAALSRLNAACRPHCSMAVTRTSVSEWPRKRCPAAANSAPMAALL